MFACSSHSLYLSVCLSLSVSLPLCVIFFEVVIPSGYFDVWGNRDECNVRHQTTHYRYVSLKHILVKPFSRLIIHMWIFWLTQFPYLSTFTNLLLPTPYFGPVNPHQNLTRYVSKISFRPNVEYLYYESLIWITHLYLFLFLSLRVRRSFRLCIYFLAIYTCIYFIFFSCYSKFTMLSYIYFRTPLWIHLPGLRFCSYISAHRLPSTISHSPKNRTTYRKYTRWWWWSAAAAAV